MEKIDWSKAPEGYPVYIKGIDLNYASGWYKELDDRYVSERGTYYMKRDSGVFTAYRSPSPAWSGEGLPPVGVRCEAAIPHTSGSDNERSFIWIEGSVIAYYEIKGKTFAWFAEDDGFYPPNALEFRPIRTPEQIAAEEREAAIKEMLEDAGRPDTAKTRDQAQLLYDAGWRKVERAQ